MGSQEENKMRSRTSWSWSRPTCHIYAYNRELNHLNAASALTAQAETSRRSTRASSVVASGESSSAARSVRAMSAAPVGTSFAGYTGYYGRQLALLNEAKSSSSASASSSAAMSASASSSALKSSVSASSASTAVKSVSLAASKTVASQEKTTTSVEKKTVKMDNLSEQAKSLEYGRRSSSKALRRAEIHAVNSGKDPRHVVVPRNFLEDDICKMVADIHIAPFEGKEITSAKAATQQGRLKVERLEKELSRVTESAMAYKSSYAKSASQMAAEAMSAMEAEAASSKKTRKTIVESSTKRVAAA